MGYFWVVEFRYKFRPIKYAMSLIVALSSKYPKHALFLVLYLILCKEMEHNILTEDQERNTLSFPEIKYLGAPTK
jgi:hypothetical protein